VEQSWSLARARLANVSSCLSPTTGWVQLRTACHSLAVHPVQNLDKNIENKYHIKAIIFFLMVNDHDNIIHIVIDIIQVMHAWTIKQKMRSIVNDEVNKPCNFYYRKLIICKMA